MTRNLRNSRWLPGVVATALLLVACGGTPVTSPAASGIPSVVLQTPINGAQVALGASVSVSGAANDTIGVDHVVLFVDGVSVASSPTGQPTALMSFSLTWVATIAGSHTLQVFAYRADGTPSQPAVVQVVVGGTASGLPLVSAPPIVTFAPGVTPKPTKKPRPSKTPTTEPTLSPTTAPTETPTTAPTPTPPPTPTPLTPPADNKAPDDTAAEPHLITLNDCSAQICPAGVLAMGSVNEQISAPGGDVLDQVYFVPEGGKSYKIELTSCSDVSDGTVWKPTLSTDTVVTGCGDWLVLQMGSTAPAQSMIDVAYAAVSGQMYNSYVFTIYLLDQ